MVRTQLYFTMSSTLGI